MEIPRVRGLSAEAFQRDFVGPQRAVVITDAVEHWPARRCWTPEYLTERFGALPVVAERLVGEPREVARSLGDDPNALTRLPGNRRDFVQRKTTLAEYLRLLRDAPEEGWYLALQSMFDDEPRLWDDLGPLPYVPLRMHRLAMQTPLVWMGPAGCVTHLHFDKLQNLVIQLWGRKRWLLFPREEMPNVYLPAPGRIDQFSPVDAGNPDLERFPRFARAQRYEFELHPGEALFVPDRWPHYVETVESSLSTNLWWLEPARAWTAPVHWAKWAVRRAMGRMPHYGG